jgi:Flp pilus assembly protein TadD
VLTEPIDDALARGVRAFEAGNFADAISQFSTAMDRDPLSPEAAVFSGIACFLLGDATSALVDLRRALVLDPELWQAELYLAMSHERLGYGSEATAAYQRLCALLTRPSRRKVSGVMTQLEAWRDEALTLARHKTRRSLPGA